MPKITQPDWKYKENRTTLTCAKCRQELDILMFTPHGKTSAGTQKYRSMCKPCYNAHASDHIDEQYWNNTRENLQFLCPNCHSLKTLDNA